MDERQEEREKEVGDLQERTEEVTEEGIEEMEERSVTKEACEEEERCEEDSECHSSAKTARVCATFTDSQEIAIVEFVKQHPELYDKEHPTFHDRHRREALWAEISAELKLQPFEVRRWFKSQRTRYGKLSKLQSGQAPREMTKRQSWVYQQMGFLKTHIKRKGANRSSGFEASPNTSKQDETRGSTTDTEHLESSVLRERSRSILTSTPVSTDSKILKHFDQMRTALYYHHFSPASTAAVAIQSGWVFVLPGPFQGHQIFQKQFIQLHVIHIPLPKPKKVQYKYLSQDKKSPTPTPPQT